LPAASTAAEPEPAVGSTADGAEVAGVFVPRGLLFAGALLVAGCVVSSALLWQKLATIQESLARQSAEAGAVSVEARTLARQAMDLSRDNAARIAVGENRLAEVALQRGQLEELLQSLSRSRDENLVVEIEAALRLAQQQAQLTGTLEPLVAALRAADQRLARAAQPRLNRVRSAIGRDLDRVKAAGVTDLPGLMLRLDELARQVDDLPLASAVPLGSPQVGPPAGRRAPAPAGAASPTARPGESAPAEPADAPGGLPAWAGRIAREALAELRALVRVSRIDQPEAALLAPDQAVFLRENLKIQLLSARLALLARQTDAARTDLAAAQSLVTRYFLAEARRTQSFANALQQVREQVRVLEMPRLDETMAALAAVGASTR